MESSPAQDIYERITQSIVAALDRGVAPWVRPWSDHADPVPTNATTRRPYRGVNFLTLQLECALRGYARNTWMTYRQAHELGAQVRRGHHGAPVVFWQLRKVAARAETEPWPDENDVNQRVIPLLRAYTVFNVAQIDGLPAHLTAATTPAEWQPDAAAEDILARAGAQIRHGGLRAYFHPAEDYIQLPERGAFATASAYYATALHELVHWTGHPKRLQRDLSGRFADAAYAMEELVAELGSAFLCAACRIDGQLQHASYIGSWLKVLRGDKRAIFVASTKAQNAADFLLPERDPLAAQAQRAA